MAQRPISAYCQYCGMGCVGWHNRDAHERICVYGPMAKPLKQFLHSLAIDGVMPSTHAYDRHRPAELPTRNYVIKQIGNWGDVADWAQLVYDPSNTPKPGIVSTGTIPDVEFIVEDEAIQEYPLLPGKERTKHLYNWRTRSYEPVVCYELR